MPIWPDDWMRVLLPDTPIVESVVRISIVYIFLVFLLRVVLKRESSGVGIADVLVIVLLADAVQNGMAGTYTSVGDALILASTLVFWDWTFSFLAYHQPWFRRLIRPKPLLIIKDGFVIAPNARSELLTRQDIKEQLLLQGIDSIDDVAEAFMLSNGEISVVRKGESAQSDTKRRKQRAI